MDRAELIAEKLVKMRGNHTQAEMAEKIGISQSTLAMYETGKRIPSDEIKIRIANVYKKSVQSIFFTN